MNISTICSFIYLFSLFLDNTYKWNNWVSMICMVYVWIFKKLTNCFTKWLYHFHSNQQCMNFSCFTSSPILGIITLLNFTHCNCFVMLFHHDFNLHFPDGWWCWTSFYVYNYCHPYSLIFEGYIRLFFYCWMLRFLYIVWMQGLSSNI